MKNVISALIVCIHLVLALPAAAQEGQTENTKHYLDLSWKQVANRMPAGWYGSNEAKLVAENVMIAQKAIGGWAKNIPYHKLSEEEKATYLKNKSKAGATFDNDGTTTELRFLAKVYSQIPDPRYKQAFENGLDYFFKAQYENGGWPQYFPVKDSADEVLLDKTAPYSMHITYNDDAMVNIMQFLEAVYSGDEAFASLQIGDDIKTKAVKAFNKGIECFLNTQIKVNGKPTVWCAQHNAVTLAPANARAYELASFSGSESVGIVRFLMEIKQPSKRVIDAVNGAIHWFEEHKLEGIKIQSYTNAEGKRDRAIAEDKMAPPIWARFYDLDTGEPYFADRDGVKRKTFAELGYERRNGYAWYTYSPQKVLDQYPAWKKKWNIGRQ